MVPTCPECKDVPLTWRDGWGYRCDQCYLFVCIPKRVSNV